MKFSLARLRKLLRPKYRLRTLFAFVTLSAVATWVFVQWPSFQRAWQVRQARARISQYERTVAGDGDASRTLPELVAIFGDSRLKHWGRVSAVETAPGNRLFSFCGDGRFRAWDVTTGEQTSVARAKLGTCSIDGSKAFLLGEQNEILVWDTAAAQVTGTLPNSSSLPILFMAANFDGTVVAAFADGPKVAQMQVWNVPAGEVSASWTLSRFVTGMSLSRDGKLLSTIHIGIDADIWDVATQKKVRSLPAAPGETPGSFARLHAVVFSADSKHVLTADGLGKVRCWEISTGKEVGPARQFVGSADHVTLDSTGEWMTLCGANTASFVDLGSKLTGPHRQQSFGRGLVTACSREMNPQAFGHHDHSISVWQSGLPVSLSPSPQSDVSCLAFTPDGKYLITGRRNGELALWHVGTWTLHKSWMGHTASVQRIAVSPRGGRFASVARDGNLVVWDTDKQQQVTSFSVSRHWISSVFTADGQQIACVGCGT